MHQRVKISAIPQGIYLPSLDGLRFLAFLAVFVHHLPRRSVVQSFGWIGVEIFFAISAFLFFHLLRIEYAATGAVSVRGFYLRRILRIYPLMLLFPIVSAAVLGPGPGDLEHYASLIFPVSNIVTAVIGYQLGIQAGAHLWTLSFELQIYLLIPFLFLLYARVGTAHFLAILFVSWAIGAGLRLAAVEAGWGHPAIWMTPVLRPESVLIGIALAVMAPKAHPTFAAAALLLAAIGLAVCGDVQSISLWQMPLYPAAAIFARCALYLALQTELLASHPLVWLGKISYGLYVYHLPAISIAVAVLARIGSAENWPATSALALTLCVGISAVSYYSLERPFLRIKDRISVIHSRPI